jgi:hypothetical protein
MRADLMESALLRVAAPDAFDEQGRMLPGQLIRCLDARDEAIRQMARLKGPMLVDLKGDS